MEFYTQTGTAARTDTAHLDWNERWQSEKGRADWIEPETFILQTIPLLQARGVRTVLDLGCGVGRHALALAEAGFDVHAMDASPAALDYVARQCQEQSMRMKLHNAEMVALPFASQCFDYVLAWNVIYHGDLPVVLRSILEILRVLKPKGLFQGSMLSKRNTEIAQGQPIAPNTFINSDNFEKRHPHYYANAQEIISLFNGFEPLHVQDVEHSRPGSFHWHLLMEKISL
ncbi:MAG: class I SAM-dependent methyltransferase [Desulfobulbaceae bacterium]|nr:class I SAM-dependent methyltransferase [Desulfobulbaceae bacterium]